MVNATGTERPQDYGDLLRLLATVQALDVREPVRQEYREQVLLKLTDAVREPRAIRGGWAAPSAGWTEGAP